MHGDIEKGFLRAEVVPAPTLLQHETYAAAREAECVRTEGRDYSVTDEYVCIKWK